MQYYSLRHQTLLLSPVSSTTPCCFHFGSTSSLSGAISPLFSSSILSTYQPWKLIFQCQIILPFHTVHCSCWIIEKASEFHKKKIYFCFIDYPKAFDCVDHSKLWKILQEMGIPDHLTCLLRNLYAGQESIVRTGCGTTD